MSGTAQFSSDRARFGAMNPCEWMSAPGFVDDGDLQRGLTVQVFGNTYRGGAAHSDQDNDRILARMSCTSVLSEFILNPY